MKESGRMGYSMVRENIFGIWSVFLDFSIYCGIIMWGNGWMDWGMGLVYFIML